MEIHTIVYTTNGLQMSSFSQLLNIDSAIAVILENVDVLFSFIYDKFGKCSYWHRMLSISKAMYIYFQIIYHNICNI